MLRAYPASHRAAAGFRALYRTSASSARGGVPGEPAGGWSLGARFLAGAISGATVVGLAAAGPASASQAAFRPRHATDPKFVSLLEDIVGKDSVSTEEEDLDEYGRDRWSHHGGTRPNIVVTPHTIDQVQRVVRLCSDHRMPLIPFGSGTSLEGHTTAPEGGVTLVMTEMHSILRVGEDDMDVTVQPGISYNELNDLLRDRGLFFPVDPGPGASIGGMVATGCSGTNAVRYGTMKQNVLNLKVVLPDGSIVRTAQRARKSSAGYDLTSLFVGSEGTLGVVVEATLRLQPIPEHSAVAVCAFPDVGAACRAVSDLTRQGVTVQCVELLDADMMHAVNLNSGLSYPRQPHLFFKFSGTKAQVEDSAMRAQTTASAFGGEHFVWETGEAEKEKLWEARKVALWAAANMRPDAKVWTTDVCVPISRFPECVAATQRDIEASSLQAPIVGHAGDGNFHVFFLIDTSRPEEMAEAIRLNRRMVHRAIEMEGTCTGEHGVGVGKKEYLARELGAGNLALMRRIKAELDPRGIMNPGKLVPETDEAVVALSAGGMRPAWARGGQCC